MSAPTPHYRQHHEVEPPRVDDTEFRPAWRKHDHVRALRDAGEISDYEYACALAFRRAAERVLAAAWPPPLWLGTIGRRGRAEQAALNSRLDQIAIVRLVHHALGGFACGLLEACLIHDFTWEYLAGCLGVDPRTARAWTVLAIKALAGSPVAPLLST
jgi:hypothetical protein